MIKRTLQVLALLAAAAGGVVVWQRRNETPAVPPTLRPPEAFMDPAPGPSGSPGAPAPAGTRPPTATAPAAADDDVDTAELPTAVHGGPAHDAGVVAERRPSLPDPPRGPFTTAPEGQKDDLKRITGVGPKLEELLNSQGITTFGQLAALDDAGVDALQARLPEFPGRIRRDDWVAQARRLAEG